MYLQMPAAWQSYHHTVQKDCKFFILALEQPGIFLSLPTVDDNYCVSDDIAD